MKTKIIAILAIVLIIFSALLLISNYNKQIIASQSPENLEINLSDFKTCCDYIDATGKLQSCIVKERFDCSVCNEKCSIS